MKQINVLIFYCHSQIPNKKENLNPKWEIEKTRIGNPRTNPHRTEIPLEQKKNPNKMGNPNPKQETTKLRQSTNKAFQENNLEQNKVDCLIKFQEQRNCKSREVADL